MVHLLRVGSISLLPSQPVEGKATTSEAPALMPESKTAQLMASGDLGAMITAMLLEAGTHSRETSRKAKDAAARQEEAASSRKIEHMKEQADKKFLAGMASSGGSFLSGVATISSAVCNKTDPAIFKGSGAGIEGVGIGASAFWSREADAANEASAQAEREMTQAKRAVESASDGEKDARELLRRALDHYKSFLSAKDDASRAAILKA